MIIDENILEQYIYALSSQYVNYSCDGCFYHNTDKCKTVCLERKKEFVNNIMYCVKKAEKGKE